ncbi:MAG TPA: hypothetical protein VMF90_10005 [Rhizobiaceae bacterium]|nr:hypothetical protein [Rhizobiaceae bacterium]
MTDFVPFSQGAEFVLPAANDTVWIAPSVMIRGSGASQAGLRGDFAGHTATIFGTVASIDYIAIRFGSDTTAPGHTLDIRDGGQVLSFHNGAYGVQLWGIGTVVKNAGLIRGDASGLTLSGKRPGNNVTGQQFRDDRNPTRDCSQPRRQRRDGRDQQRPHHNREHHRILRLNGCRYDKQQRAHRRQCFPRRRQ